MSLSPPSMTVPFFESTWYVIFFPPVCQNLRHCDSHVFFSFPFCLLCATPQGPLVVVTLQSFHQHLSGRIYCAVITAHSCLKCTKFNWVQFRCFIHWNNDDLVSSPGTAPKTDTVCFNWVWPKNFQHEVYSTGAPQKQKQWLDCSWMAICKFV